MKSLATVPTSHTMKQHHRDFGQLAEQPTKSLHSEYDRPFCKHDMGLTIRTSDNTPRPELIAQKVCSVGLVILLCITMALFMLAAFKVIPLAVPLVVSAFFLFCAFITLPESPNEN